MRLIVFALTSLLLFASFGCEVADQLEGMRTVQAEYEPKGRKMLIIPFAPRGTFNGQKRRPSSRQTQSPTARNSSTLRRWKALKT